MMQESNKGVLDMADIYCLLLESGSNYTSITNNL